MTQQTVVDASLVVPVDGANAAATASASTAAPGAENPPVALTPVAEAVVGSGKESASKRAMDFLDDDDDDEPTAPTAQASEDDEQSPFPDLDDDAEEDQPTAGASASADTEESLFDEGPAAEVQATSGIFLVCKKKCLTCKALVPWAEKTFKQCHFSNGNENCPAAEAQVQILIPFNDIVPRFVSAHESNDTDRLIRLYEKLKKRPDYVQNAVHAKIKEALAARAAVAAEA
jgi:hypothetical protein